jgi:hypothetical protein
VLVLVSSQRVPVQKRMLPATLPVVSTSVKDSRVLPKVEVEVVAHPTVQTRVTDWAGVQDGLLLLM